jgi:hypothetical protein
MISNWEIERGAGLQSALTAWFSRVAECLLFGFHRPERTCALTQDQLLQFGRH